MCCRWQNDTPCSATIRFPLEYVRWVIPKLSPSLGKLCWLIPQPLNRLVLPLRGGEMLIVARKIKPASEAADTAAARRTLAACGSC